MNSEFKSPLKRGTTGDFDINSKASKKLNFDGSIENRVEKVCLDAIYHFDFNPSFVPSVQELMRFPNIREQAVREHNAQLEDLKRQVIEIENVLTSINDPQSTQICREKVRNILSLDQYELKIAELGMVLFYLDKNNALPPSNSFVAFRATQIEKEVESYIANHREKRLDPIIPTGKTHYLMRALAHMVLTSSQIYNKGGLFAIKALLTNAQYKISIYLQPEHRIHILNIVDQLLKDKSFESLFASKVNIHPSLEDVIRLDVKFPIKAKISSVHVLYACIMSLFADIRQFDPPNCYAVGTLIYVSENHTYRTLAKLIDFLTVGNYMDVPLCSLLEKRIAYNDDNDQIAKAERSVPMEQICQILNLDSVRFHQNHPQRCFAERIYNTYKYSALVELQLALIEFIYMNSDKENREKSLYIESITAAIESRLPTRTLEANFRDKFKRNLSQRIWLENCNETHVRYEKNTLHVGNRKMNQFKGNMMNFIPLFKRSLRMFSLTKHRGQPEYQMIWSFKDLRKVLLEVFIQTEKELSYKKSLGNLKQMAQKVIESEAFNDQLCNIVAKQIGEGFSITPKDLSYADILILDQTGGKEELALEEVYGISPAITNFNRCESPDEFLQILLKWISSGNLFRMKNVPKLLIATQSHHTWTLAPSCWELLLSHRNDFHGFIHEMVFHPTDQRLQSWIPFDVRAAVIDRYIPNEKVRQQWKNGCSDKNLTFGSFRDLLFEKVRVRERAILANIIEEEYSKALLTPQELSKAFNILRLSYDNGVMTRLFGAIANCRALPHVLAKKLHRALIQEGMLIIDPYQLELAICHVKDLPLTICLGDYNWVNLNTEDPEHCYIVIRTSWVTSNARYCIRVGEKESFEPNDNYHYFQITFPKDLA
jgi:hypothetical protein